MILVLSGTRDGRKIIEILLNNGHNILATTATEYGGSLIKDHPSLMVISRPLDKNDMEKVIIDKGIKIIVDATHPYAREVSKNAIEASIATQASYLRYERKEGSYEGTIKVEGFSEAAQLLESRYGNVLLTIGSNHLHEFAKLPEKEKLFVRVLPTPAVIEKCKSLGFFT